MIILQYYKCGTRNTFILIRINQLAVSAIRCHQVPDISFYFYIMKNHEITENPTNTKEEDI
jgi:hypothetical protein